jgi:hypothetical protein
MSNSDSFLWQLARLLMRVVAWLMPEDQTEWAAAMRAEMESLESDYLAAAWAYGCLAVAIRTRANMMVVGDLRVSKWVFVLEMACCFLPLTLFWLLLLSYGFDPDVFITPYLVAPDDIFVLLYLLSMAVLGIFGLVGSLVALQHIAQWRSVRHYPLGALIVGLTLLGIVNRGSHLVLGGPGWWHLGVLLYVILPVVGAAHLRYLASKEPVQQAVA